MVADAHELRPIRAQGIDLAVAPAPAVEIHHGPRVRVPPLGGKTTADIPIWRTAALGTYKTIDALRDALGARRIRVGSTANEMLGRPEFNLSKMRRDARLVVLAVSQLGFEEDGASLADIYARARQLGFELCPAEVGPQLRLQYLNQPLGEFLHIAMAPIAGYAGEPTDFTVANGGAGLILIGSDAYPNLIMPSAMRFVFIGPESPQRAESNRPGPLRPQTLSKGRTNNGARRRCNRGAPATAAAAQPKPSTSPSAATGGVDLTTRNSEHEKRNTRILGAAELPS
jgi:hypothetical protein